MMKSPVVLAALLSLAVLPHSGCKQDPSPLVDAPKVRDLSSGDGPTSSRDVSSPDRTSPADGPALDTGGHSDAWPASGHVFRAYKLAGCGGKQCGRDDSLAWLKGRGW